MRLPRGVRVCHRWPSPVERDCCGLVQDGLRSPCYSHMSIERCTIDILSDSYRQMYERVQAGGGLCVADEVSRKSADVHLP